MLGYPSERITSHQHHDHTQQTRSSHAAARGQYPYQHWQVVGMLQYLCTTCRPDLPPRSSHVTAPASITMASSGYLMGKRHLECCARSVAEAEFVSLSTCTAEALYLRQLLCELGLNGSAVPIRGAARAHSVLAHVGRSAAVPGIIRTDSTAALAIIKCRTSRRLAE